jgi:hypothetical protein
MNLEKGPPSMEILAKVCETEQPPPITISKMLRRTVRAVG